MTQPEYTSLQWESISTCLASIRDIRTQSDPSTQSLINAWDKLTDKLEGTEAHQHLSQVGAFLGFMEGKGKDQPDTLLVDLIEQALDTWITEKGDFVLNYLRPINNYVLATLGLADTSYRDEPPLVSNIERELTALSKPVAPKPVEKKVTTPNETKKSKAQGGFGKEQDITRVKNAILSELLVSSEELVQIRNTLEDISTRLEDEKLKEISSKLSMVSSNILENLLAARMRPVNTMLAKYNRIVHDLSKELNKNVKLEIDAEGIELDINILEAIKEPLTHIVRNSLDHGIETPEERLSRNKPAEGHLTIQARNETGNVVISIQDDGKGINPDSVANKAIEKNILSPEEAEQLSKKEKLELVFHPGLSTAEKVSSISGRGVGMNVVKSQVEDFQGSVSIDSQVDQGTEINLRFPLTMATLRVAILNINNIHYALPSKDIHQLISISPTDPNGRVRFENDTALLNRNGTIIPLFEARFFLNPSLAPPPLKQSFQAGKRSSVVIFESNHCQYGLVVDDIVSFMDIIIKPIDEHTNPIGLFSGTAVLGDASLAMVFDLKKLIDTIERQYQHLFDNKEPVIEPINTPQKKSA